MVPVHCVEKEVIKAKEILLTEVILIIGCSTLQTIIDEVVVCKNSNLYRHLLKKEESPLTIKKLMGSDRETTYSQISKCILLNLF